MNRLASRSPAAPFQTSRPAPVSHDSDQARTRELKHLKARVDELEEENERFREAATIGLKAAKHAKSLEERHEPKIGVGARRETKKRVYDIKRALDDGGDADA